MAPARRCIALVTVLIALVGGCSEEDPGPPLFRPGVRQVIVEVAYAPGVAPYTGRLTGNAAVWDVFLLNYLQLLGTARKTLLLPTSLPQMQQIPETLGDEEEITQARILALAAQHRTQHSSGSSVAYYVLFLPGYFHDGERRRDDLLGLSIGDTGVIAMFKRLIRQAAAEDVPSQEAMAEQSVLLHEFGHAIGLVNRGVPVTSPHHDADNGAHCKETECLMYHHAEGLSRTRELARQAQLTGAINLFGPECLRDVSDFIQRHLR